MSDRKNHITFIILNKIIFMNNDNKEIDNKLIDNKEIHNKEIDSDDNETNSDNSNDSENDDEAIVYNTILKTLEKLKSFNNIIKVISDDINENINKLTNIYNNIYYLKN